MYTPRRTKLRGWWWWCAGLEVAEERNSIHTEQRFLFLPSHSQFAANTHSNWRNAVCSKTLTHSILSSSTSFLLSSFFSCTKYWNCCLFSLTCVSVPQYFSARMYYLVMSDQQQQQQLQQQQPSTSSSDQIEADSSGNFLSTGRVGRRNAG